jgi:polyphosphate:AMP phosphotransferase
MFESAEVGHRIAREEYAREMPKLREALLQAQFDLAADARFPVLIVIGGVDGAGKGETVNLLNEWMDPRHIHTVAFGDPSDEEIERPAMWRFWRELPPKGKIGIVFGSWYTDPIVDRVSAQAKNGEVRRAIDRIVRFEDMLFNEGTLILKFWFHLSRKQQKKRLRQLEGDPLTRWRVSPIDWERYALYERFRDVSEEVLRETSTGRAPWNVVEGADPRYRALTVGRVLLEAIQRRLKDKEARRPVTQAAPPVALLDSPKLVRDLDLTQKLARPQYERKREKLQGALNLLARDKRFRKRSLILVFEGSDAAGKGGAIRRVTGALDARQFGIVPVAAPTEEERAQPYLWRFWRHVPRQGRVTIFDRSWYGRVLVERVEGFCGDADWMRAYSEINDFEEQLVESGVVLCKFWLQISKKMQLERFREREATSFKRFKITDEDWRNRKKWDDYESAVADMVDRTSTADAPWTLVEAEDKLFARVKVLRTVVERLKESL